MKQYGRLAGAHLFQQPFPCGKAVPSLRYRSGFNPGFQQLHPPGNTLIFLLNFFLFKLSRMGFCCLQTNNLNTGHTEVVISKTSANEINKAFKLSVHTFVGVWKLSINCHFFESFFKLFYFFNFRKSFCS